VNNLQYYSLRSKTKRKFSNPSLTIFFLIVAACSGSPNQNQASQLTGLRQNYAQMKPKLALGGVVELLIGIKSIAQTRSD
jgi:hypothetical protein